MAYYGDEWPTIQGGTDFDGKDLLTLVRNGNSPFVGAWDVNLLIQEVEENLATQVIDIPVVSGGANYYGIHLKLSNLPDVVARLSRRDVNMPNYKGFPIDLLVSDVKFEAAVYELVRSDTGILASRLLYHRVPVHVPPRLSVPQDIAGRSLFLFERSEGENNIIPEGEEKSLLSQAAHIRASLFNFNPPLKFATDWFLQRLFEQKPKSFPIPVAPTREFCVALFISKIEATIRNIGDMIGWEDDNATVGPVAAAAKQSLLQLIPHIIPLRDEGRDLYRLVLDHGDFGIHNMSITKDANGLPLVTSVYDWETACIVPAMLSDPLMRLAVDLVTNEEAAPSLTGIYDSATPTDIEEYTIWAEQYFTYLFERVPSYKLAIQAGKDARHIWFALRDWRGEDPEGYFGQLGSWAEKRMKDLGINGSTRFTS